ncbi:restriction endonuclease [uncultured Christiangramia sp.]|uniref:McrC family protein n=1 Tax=uncultured Christiangramia sp. TaxID=503836 RepID=UPI00260FDE86|nr:restriction endonuclease [uncultured Christiangramia sp.]
MKNNQVIQVYEHEFRKIGGAFKKKHLKAFSKLNSLNDDCYFDLRYNGIKFKNYVGVIEVDGLTVEILPKIDSSGNDNPGLWRDVLINMLKATKKLKVQKVGEANVSKQKIHLLDIYFEWYLSEVELLVRQGLIKQYYRKAGNVKALKGKLEFAGHLQKNLIHKERFYTTHQVYDYDHQIHQILSYALAIIEHFSKGTYLYSKCKSVQLNFPEVAACKIDANTFKKLRLNRKSQPYKTALEIARLIILQYAPNISSGDEKMLALLFDMNMLWEEYVLVQLKSAARTYKNFDVYSQRSQSFWPGVSIRPDIIIETDKETFVLDTKWKNIRNHNPSAQDLRQMYVYNDYWKKDNKPANSLLLYPTTDKTNLPIYKKFVDRDHNCAIGKLNILKNTKLDVQLGSNILEQWLEIDNLGTS